ncbi:MAG: MBL fold metallo-hydrolase [Bdellovibrionales bacterium]
MKINFWGVRGTLPVSGEHTTKYGGSTSCVSLELSSGELLIFDAGSGIRQLGKELVEGRISQKEFSIFISHPHWDHINAIPFCLPLYKKEYKCHFYGPKNQSVTMKKMISDQMDGVYFPITIGEFKADLSFRDLGEASNGVETIQVGEAQVSTAQLNHPGKCLGYKVQAHGQTFAYVTDNEIFDKNSSQFDIKKYENLKNFIYGVDILITDTTYSNEEYKSKIGWGHSSVGQVVELAHEASVKKLCLFHHDPDQNDKQIDEKLKWAQRKLKELGSTTICHAPVEGSELILNQNVKSIGKPKITLGKNSVRKVG